MNDFLSRLVARTQAATPALRPNPVSRFEPAHDAPAQLAAMDSGDRSLKPTQPNHPVAGPREERITIHTATSPGMAEPVREKTERTKPAATSSPARESPLPSPPVPERIAPRPLPDKNQIAAQPMAAAPRSTDAAPTRPKPITPPLLPIALQREAEKSLPHSESALRRIGSVPSRDGLAPVPTSLPSVAKKLSAPPVAEPRRPGNIVEAITHKAPVPAAPFPKQLPSIKIAAPAVHVTIGRLEIRAIPPPALPVERPSAPIAPSISLEDYIRRANGGAR